MGYATSMPPHADAGAVRHEVRVRWLAETAAAAGIGRAAQHARSGELSELFRDGTFLCRLIAHLQPRRVLRYHRRRAAWQRIASPKIAQHNIEEALNVLRQKSGKTAQIPSAEAVLHDCGDRVASVLLRHLWTTFAAVREPAPLFRWIASMTRPLGVALSSTATRPPHETLVEELSDGVVLGVLCHRLCSNPPFGKSEGDLPLYARPSSAAAAGGGAAEGRVLSNLHAVWTALHSNGVELWLTPEEWLLGADVDVALAMMRECQRGLADTPPRPMGRAHCLSFRDSKKKLGAVASSGGGGGGGGGSKPSLRRSRGGGGGGGGTRTQNWGAGAPRHQVDPSHHPPPQAQPAGDEDIHLDDDGPAPEQAEQAAPPASSAPNHGGALPSRGGGGVGRRRRERGSVGPPRASSPVFGGGPGRRASTAGSRAGSRRRAAPATQPDSALDTHGQDSQQGRQRQQPPRRAAAADGAVGLDRESGRQPQPQPQQSAQAHAEGGARQVSGWVRSAPVHGHTVGATWAAASTESHGSGSSAAAATATGMGPPANQPAASSRRHAQLGTVGPSAQQQQRARKLAQAQARLAPPRRGYRVEAPVAPWVAPQRQHQHRPDGGTRRWRQQQQAVAGIDASSASSLSGEERRRRRSRPKPAPARPQREDVKELQALLAMEEELEQLLSGGGGVEPGVAQMLATEPSQRAGIETLLSECRQSLRKMPADVWADVIPPTDEDDNEDEDEEQPEEDRARLASTSATSKLPSRRSSSRRVAWAPSVDAAQQ
jgi:hypothetical protein